MKVGGLFKWFSGQWRNARKAVLNLSALPKPDSKQLLSLLPKLIQYADGIEHMDKLNRNDQCLNKEYLGIETPIERLVELRAWYKAIRAEYGIGFGERVEMGNALIALDRNQAMAIQDFAAKELPALIHSAEQSLSKLSQLYSHHAPLKDQQAAISETVPKLLASVVKQTSVLTGLVTGADVTLGQLNSARNLLIEQHKQLVDWKTNALVQVLADAGLKLSVVPQQFSERDLQLGSSTLAIVQVLESATAIHESLKKQPDEGMYNALQAGGAAARATAECV